MLISPSVPESLRGVPIKQYQVPGLPPGTEPHTSVPRSYYLERLDYATEAYKQFITEAMRAFSSSVKNRILKKIDRKRDEIEQLILHQVSEENGVTVHEIRTLICEQIRGELNSIKETTEVKQIGGASCLQKIFEMEAASMDELFALPSKTLTEEDQEIFRSVVEDATMELQADADDVEKKLYDLRGLTLDLDKKIGSFELDKLEGAAIILGDDDIWDVFPGSVAKAFDEFIVENYEQIDALVSIGSIYQHLDKSFQAFTKKVEALRKDFQDVENKIFDGDMLTLLRKKLTQYDDLIRAVKEYFIKNDALDTLLKGTLLADIKEFMERVMVARPEELEADSDPALSKIDLPVPVTEDPGDDVHHLFEQPETDLHQSGLERVANLTPAEDKALTQFLDSNPLLDYLFQAGKAQDLQACLMTMDRSSIRKSGIPLKIFGKSTSTYNSEYSLFKKLFGDIVFPDGAYDFVPALSSELESSTAFHLEPSEMRAVFLKYWPLISELLDQQKIDLLSELVHFMDEDTFQAFGVTIESKSTIPDIMASVFPEIVDSK